MKHSSSSKPISSPGRALIEKFPPPLMRFLRSNISSKSIRAKSKHKTKTTPLFFRKKKPTGDTQQEPSSPKVTCIGQVRVRRSKNARSRSHPLPDDKHRCRFAGKCLCPTRIIPNAKNGVRYSWRKCVSFFCCRPAKVRTESGSNRVRFEDCNIRNRSDDEESENEKTEKSVIAASEITPPKNALILTRCRSAPYRSSSLACRLWSHEEEEERETPAQKTENREELTVTTSLDSGTEVEGGCGDSASENGAENKEEEKEREEKAVVAAAAAPLTVVMRCRSEPARRGNERLDPLTSEFWRERRRLSLQTTCS